MTLSEALSLGRAKVETTSRRELWLTCGFEPLHLATFVRAHFARRFPGMALDLKTGLYGDLAGTLASAAESNAEGAMVVLEWSDVDPRLGLRSAGGWALGRQPDIVQSARERFSGILQKLSALTTRMPVALIPPTLGIPFLGHTVGWQASAAELELQRELMNFLSEAARIPGVAIANAQALQRARGDAMMELKAGFPYTIDHASLVAEVAVKLITPPAPMKGLITDLDDTLWAGIVGEVGPLGVHWNLTEHAQVHGLYQQMLAHLAEMGVLLAVASKNEAAVVEETLRREDLLLQAEALFPVKAGWGRKSDAIGEILKAWNIGADSVVFIDDSPMELDEVRAAFPTMTCRAFPKAQAGKVVELLAELRDLFGKPVIGKEDALRQASIRANAELEAESGGQASMDFVRKLEGKVTFDGRKDPANKRLLELVNKTNQFNLNGVRVSEGEWMNLLNDNASIVLGTTYEEKFGPLGTIGVLAGRQHGDEFAVSSWVLSCRAFSRRIEHHMLQQVFKERGVQALRFAYRPTERNQPLRKVLAGLGLAVDAAGELRLTREQFESSVEGLPHRVNVVQLAELA